MPSIPNAQIIPNVRSASYDPALDVSDLLNEIKLSRQTPPVKITEPALAVLQNPVPQSAAQPTQSAAQPVAHNAQSAAQPPRSTSVRVQRTTIDPRKIASVPRHDVQQNQPTAVQLAQPKQPTAVPDTKLTSAPSTVSAPTTAKSMPTTAKGMPTTAKSMPTTATCAPITATCAPITVASAPITAAGMPVTTDVASPKITTSATKRSKASAELSKEEIGASLVGFFRLDRSQWASLTPGACIRYFRQGTEPKAQRFRLGGYIREITSTYISLSKFYTNTGFATRLQIADVDQIWKQYGQSAAIELNMLYATVEKLQKELEELKAAVASQNRQK